MKLRFPVLALGAVVSLTLGQAVGAHPRLVSAKPAANAASPAVRIITLTFNERLKPQVSKAELVMTGMPGMAQHPDMKVAGIASMISPDGKSLILTSGKPLVAATYRVDWTIVGTDNHPATGKHIFSIR